MHVCVSGLNVPITITVSPTATRVCIQKPSSVQNLCETFEVSMYEERVKVMLDPFRSMFVTRKSGSLEDFFRFSVENIP